MSNQVMYSRPDREKYMKALISQATIYETTTIIYNEITNSPRMCKIRVYKHIDKTNLVYDTV